jgi:hypothetical protein
MRVHCAHYQGICDHLVCPRESGYTGNIKSRASRRVTLFAAVSEIGVPAINVWDFNRSRLERLVSDRHANGQAFPGEHVVQMTERFYDSLLRAHGLPERTREPGEL